MSASEIASYSSGYYIGPYPVPAIWSTDNSTVVNMNPAVDGKTATCTALSPGQVDIEAYIGTFEFYSWDGLECIDNGGSYEDAGVAFAAVRPTISGPTTLWWFFNENPSGYATSITLTASSGSGSYSWQIVNGTAQIQFSNNSSSIVTSTNQVTVKSINSSGTQLDCGIQVTVAGMQSNVFKLTKS